MKKLRRSSLFLLFMSFIVLFSTIVSPIGVEAANYKEHGCYRIDKTTSTIHIILVSTGNGANLVDTVTLQTNAGSLPITVPQEFKQWLQIKDNPKILDNFYSVENSTNKYLTFTYKLTENDLQKTPIGKDFKISSGTMYFKGGSKGMDGACSGGVDTLPTAISIEPNNLAIYAGESRTLTATPSINTPDYNWKSNNQKVSVIQNTNKYSSEVKGNEVGTATITLSRGANNNTATAVIKVNPKISGLISATANQQVSIPVAGLPITALNSSVEIKIDQGENLVSNKIFNNQDKVINITPNATGIIKLKVIYTENGEKYTSNDCTINVSKTPAKDIYPSKAQHTIYVNQELNLKEFLVVEKYNVNDQPEISWLTDDQTKVSVSQTGTIKGLSQATSIQVTAVSGDKRAIFYITVLKYPHISVTVKNNENTVDTIKTNDDTPDLQYYEPKKNVLDSGYTSSASIELSGYNVTSGKYKIVTEDEALSIINSGKINFSGAGSLQVGTSSIDLGKKPKTLYIAVESSTPDSTRQVLYGPFIIRDDSLPTITLETYNGNNTLVDKQVSNSRGNEEQNLNPAKDKDTLGVHLDQYPSIKLSVATIEGDPVESISYQFTRDKNSLGNWTELSPENSGGKIKFPESGGTYYFVANIYTLNKYVEVVYGPVQVIKLTITGDNELKAWEGSKIYTVDAENMNNYNGNYAWEPEDSTHYSITQEKQDEIKLEGLTNGNDLLYVTDSTSGAKAYKNILVSVVNGIYFPTKEITINVDESIDLDNLLAFSPEEAKRYFKVTWDSDTKQVATVNQDGVVTGKQEGYSSISATVKTKSSEFAEVILVKVQDPTNSNDPENPGNPEDPNPPEKPKDPKPSGSNKW